MNPETRRTRTRDADDVQVLRRTPIDPRLVCVKVLPAVRQSRLLPELQAEERGPDHDPHPNRHLHRRAATAPTRAPRTREDDVSRESAIVALDALERKRERFVTAVREGRETFVTDVVRCDTAIRELITEYGFRREWFDLPRRRSLVRTA